MNTLLAVLFVVGVWWLSTAVVLRLVWLPRRTHRRSIGIASVLAVAGLVASFALRNDDTSLGACLGFLSGIALWGWHELTFLLGRVTGSRRGPCPPGLEGWPRFSAATEAVIHHELALAATMAAVVALSWKAPNQVAAWTFGVLWLMRLSAKLNIFLGVQNLQQEFVPPHLRYLTSYFRVSRLNPLMPFSLGIASFFAFFLFTAVTPASDGEATGLVLSASLLTLAIFEHLFLAIPVPDAWLWRWATKGIQ
ncbi:MAG: putative photosynthetic complex assembly protein PuhE [Myxococcota bacterium]